MKALIDTNIVLDFLCKRKGFFDDANIIFQHCFSDVDGVIAAHTVSKQNECAIMSEVDYIVTRNIGDFKDAELRVVSPKEFIEIVR